MMSTVMSSLDMKARVLVDPPWLTAGGVLLALRLVMVDMSLRVPVLGVERQRRHLGRVMVGMDVSLLSVCMLVPVDSLPLFLKIGQLRRLGLVVCMALRVHLHSLVDRLWLLLGGLLLRPWCVMMMGRSIRVLGVR